jgi:hypothetical protein
VQFLIRKDKTLEPDSGKSGKFQNTPLALTLPFHRFDRQSKERRPREEGAFFEVAEKPF